MHDIPYQDIFTCPENQNQAICVTTNGVIKNNNNAVMGRGLALEIDNKFHIAKKLAEHIRTNGNVPCDFGLVDSAGQKYRLLSFPTKNHWRDPSDINLIANSAKILVELANKLKLEKIYTVRPGCGLGRLDYETQVRPIISKILDDRFYIIANPK